MAASSWIQQYSVSFCDHRDHPLSTHNDTYAPPVGICKEGLARSGT
jgi:hypothetical protein